MEAARVLQEDEYYSFGLRKAYGGYDFSNNNRYLYNGKEIQTDLSNQYDYGARFYDPVIARWTSVDPLAEKDRRWSSYSYGHDNPIRMIDVDGLFVAPGDLFASADAAAEDFGKYYNGKSITQNKEYNSTVYKVVKDGKTYYSYSKSSEDGSEFSSEATPAPKGTTVVGKAHTHSAGDPSATGEDSPNQFSKADMANRDKDGLSGYVATPDGSLKKYDPATKQTKNLSSSMPSDPNDPNRKNDISPITGKSDKQTRQEANKVEPAKRDAIPNPPKPPEPIKRNDNQNN